MNRYRFANLIIYLAFFLGGIHLVNAISLFMDAPNTNFLNIGLGITGFLFSFLPWLRGNGEWLIPMKIQHRIDFLIASMAIKAGLAITWFVGV